MGHGQSRTAPCDHKCSNSVDSFACVQKMKTVVFNETLHLLYVSVSPSSSHLCWYILVPSLPNVLSVCIYIRDAQQILIFWAVAPFCSIKPCTDCSMRLNAISMYVWTTEQVLQLFNFSYIRSVAVLTWLCPKPFSTMSDQSMSYRILSTSVLYHTQQRGTRIQKLEAIVSAQCYCEVTRTLHVPFVSFAATLRKTFGLKHRCLNYFSQFRGHIQSKSLCYSERRVRPVDVQWFVSARIVRLYEFF